MATRVKTVEYAFPVITTMADNLLAPMTPITVYIPESGVTFRKVVALASAAEYNSGTSATGNINGSRRLDFQLGSNAVSTVTNTNVYTGSGEDLIAWHAGDFTAYFTTNWTGTSMTLSASLLFDFSTTITSWTNVSLTFYITYEYDDTSATQIKTVRIPLNAPTGALATTKPGSPTATIPNLSTELPEASKTFRNWFITVQGNMAQAAATADNTMSMQLDTTAAFTSAQFEGGAATDYFYRLVWEAPNLNTSASMGFYLWASAAKFNHPQAWLTVTYEFDATASNDVYVSVLLPMEVTSPMGSSATAYQRGSRELFIEEPGTPTLKSAAFYVFWDQAAAMSGLNMRIGTGSFVTYTDTAAVVAGSNAAMVRNDSAFTLARGRNSGNFDCYNSDTADYGFNVSGFWLLNYTASKPTQGYGAANHTVFYNLSAVFDGAANARRIIAATAPDWPTGDKFFSAIGTRYLYYTNTTGTASGIEVLVERLAAEGGIIWEPAYIDLGYTDPETGLHQCFSQVRTLFQRWPNDPDTDRLDLETARRWITVLNNGALSYDYLDLVVTYHNITFPVTGSVSGSSGGTVTLDLKRATNGETVLRTTRVGDGSFTFNWYDDTEDVYVTAYEDSTHVGRSAQGTA